MIYTTKQGVNLIFGNNKEIGLEFKFGRRRKFLHKAAFNFLVLVQCFNIF